MADFKNIVGIKFKSESKVYTFLAGDLSLKREDQVIVETERGLALGTVVKDVSSIPAHRLPPEIKPVLRRATEEDIKRYEENCRLEKEAFAFCKERITARALPMKLVGIDCNLDRSKITFYFTAENRVDFRELVKDLVQRFRTRIELRQISARQESRIVKGIGICGREVCCAGIIPLCERVSIKMAKEQGLSLNPEKISGICGRLMCCLAFEYETYLEMKKGLPKCGKTVQTHAGCGKVVRHNVLKGELVVNLEDGREIVVKADEFKSP